MNCDTAFDLMTDANGSRSGALVAATAGGSQFVPMGALFGEIVATIFVLQRFRSAVDQAPASPNRPIEAPSGTS